MKLVNLELNQKDLEKIPNHYVLFSGGADSTLILLQLAWAAKRANSVKQLNTIELVNHSNLYDKVTKAQNKAKDKIIKHIENKYNLKINRIQVKTDISYIKTDSLLWGVEKLDTTGGHIPLLTATLLNCAVSIDTGSAIHIGLISDDHDSYLKAQYMKETIEVGMHIFNRGKVTVNFPLIDYSKQFIMNVMDENELLDIISYCENPNYDSKKKIYVPCGTCGSCKTLVGKYVTYEGNPNDLKRNPYTIPKLKPKKKVDLSILDIKETSKEKTNKKKK